MDELQTELASSNLLIQKSKVECMYLQPKYLKENLASVLFKQFTSLNLWEIINIKAGLKKSQLPDFIDKETILMNYGQTFF